MSKNTRIMQRANGWWYATDLGMVTLHALKSDVRRFLNMSDLAGWK